jgi:hypothetical protein
MEDKFFESAPSFSRRQFSIDDVSEVIRPMVLSNFSALLRKMSETTLEAIGDRLQLHKSNICRIKDNGELLKVAATTVAIGVDIVAMEEEIKELRRQNAAFQVLLEAKLKDHLSPENVTEKN